MDPPKQPDIRASPQPWLRSTPLRQLRSSGPFRGSHLDSGIPFSCKKKAEDGIGKACSSNHLQNERSLFSVALDLSFSCVSSLGQKTRRANARLVGKKCSLLNSLRHCARLRRIFTSPTRANVNSVRLSVLSCKGEKRLPIPTNQ